MTNPSQSNSPANSPIAPDETEAQRRFAQYRSTDPFPDILPALLNSADIYDYVAATGMIFPFDQKKLKSASYEVKLLGKCVYWDEDGSYKSEEIKEGQSFTLKPNSIAFVTLEPTLCLPDYIAVRFNLKITNVYRGLLLGTGPLVDPGFVGKLSLPLHNLTANSYKFRGGEPLIWMEFTKLSSNNRWRPSTGQTSAIGRNGQYKPFRNQPCDVEGYLHKADPHRSIRSSIPNVIQSAQLSAAESLKSAQNAASSAENATQRLTELQRKFTTGALIGVGLSIIAIVISSWGLGGLFLSTSDYLNNTREQNLDYKEKIKTLEQEIQALKKRINQLENSAKRSTQKPPATPKASPTATP
ncbi:hypothetical protein NDI39_08070 [Microcoleus sp. ZQ-A2]|nr:hypothetical protein [Microcoleus sp. FACHB-1]